MNIAAPTRSASFQNAAQIGTADQFDDQRDAIDHIAMLRTRANRIALIATLIHRPDPVHGHDSTERASQLEILKTEIQEFGQARDLLFGVGHFDTLPVNLCDWIAAQAKSCPEVTQAVDAMLERSQVLLQNLVDGADETSETLADHLTVSGGEYLKIITVFCNQLWGNLDEKRKQDTTKANKTTKAVGDILSRLEYIGKHVRLVSLNASVEAARAGDAGRGLAVIATEFKTLAEEIQSLAHQANAQIEAI